jgi:D-glycero-beta-D-manno-heptose-7-phosphate kinase
VGDLMLDEFITGKVSRISPEAPVPVLEVQKTAHYPGGAANVARNLGEFISRPGIAGIVGRDGAGEQLLKLLGEENVRTDAVFQSPYRPTTQKTRIVARHQQVVRFDRESREVLNNEERAWLVAKLREEIRDHDAIIIEDYAKGMLDQGMVSLIIQEARHAGKIVTADPNPNQHLDWSGATAVKPNRAETFQAAGLTSGDDDEAVPEAAAVLLERWDVKYLLVTLGESGMLLFEPGAAPYHTPTKAQEVFDVSGAGDTSIAVFTLALAAGATGIEAAEMANHAAGVVVGKLGTATLTPEELRASFRESARP